MIIVPQYNSGEQIGKSVGGHIQNALENWSKTKLHNMLERHKVLKRAKVLKALFPDIDDERLNDLAEMEPEMLGHLLSPRGLLRQKLGGAVDNLMRDQMDPMEQESPEQALFGQMPTKMTSNRQRFSPKKLKPLNTKLVDAFLRKAKNDPKLARDMAQKAGYQI